MINKFKKLTCVAAIGLVAACNAGDSDSSDTASEQIGEVDLGDNPIGALQLSSSISTDVPDSVSATGEGLSLTAMLNKDKSREACEIRQRIREAKMNVEQMAMDLCFIESIKGMAPGGKYELTFDFAGGPEMGLVQDEFPGDEFPGDELGDDDFPGGDEMGPGGEDGGDFPGGEMEEMKMSVWLDNSDEDAFKVYVCDGDELTQKIVIEDAKEGGSKGRYAASFDFGGSTVQLQGTFDNNVSEEGRNITNSQMAFKFSFGSDSMYAKSNMYMNLAEKAVSIVKVANEMSDSSEDFSSSNKLIGAALIDEVHGAALFQRSHSGSDSFFGDEGAPALELADSEVVETSRSYFDSKGQSLAQSDSDKFGEEGDLRVDPDTHFIKLLPEDFEVKLEGWDCKGTTPLKFDMDEKAIEQCQGDFESAFSEETCDGSGYIVGTQDNDIETEFLTQREEKKDFADFSCPAATPFVCPDASCAKDASQCASLNICPAGKVRCGDGSCQLTAAECSASN